MKDHLVLKATHRYDLPAVPIPELDEAAAAMFLGMPVRTLKTLRARKQGPAFYKVGVGPKARVRYKPEDLRAWNARRIRRVEPGKVKAAK